MDMKKKEWILVFGVILLSCCLIAPITSVGALLPQIQTALGLSSGAAGLLTTIPLLVYAALSLLAGSIGRRWGAGRTVICGILCMLAGLLIRAYLGTAGLFLGTVLIAGGICIGNVLLPAMIKAFFPHRVGLITSLHAVSMSLFAGIAGGISVPVAAACGWQTALAVWIPLVLLALVFWLPNRRCALDTGTTPGRSKLLRSGTTWWICLYTGIQSRLFYCMATWFCAILQSKGYSAEAAGYDISIYMFLGIPTSFLVPILTTRCKNRGLLGMLWGLIYAVGIAAMIFADNPAAFVIALLCCGLSSGTCISFTRVIFSLSTTTPQEASALSGLAQAIGYLLASVAPSVMGSIFDAAHSWTPPLLILLGFALLLTLAGYQLGKENREAAP